MMKSRVTERIKIAIPAILESLVAVIVSAVDLRQSGRSSFARLFHFARYALQAYIVIARLVKIW